MQINSFNQIYWTLETLFIKSHNDVQTLLSFQNTFIFIFCASQTEKLTNDISLVSFNKAVTHVAHRVYVA